MSVDRHLLQSQQQAPHASASDKLAAQECEAQIPTIGTEDPETDEAPLFGTSESEDDVGDDDVLNSGGAQPQRREHLQRLLPSPPASTCHSRSSTSTGITLPVGRGSSKRVGTVLSQSPGSGQVTPLDDPRRSPRLPDTASVHSEVVQSDGHDSAVREARSLDVRASTRATCATLPRSNGSSVTVALGSQPSSISTRAIGDNSTGRPRSRPLSRDISAQTSHPDDLVPRRKHRKRPSPTPEPVAWEAARVSVPARALPPARFAPTRTEARADSANSGMKGSHHSPTTFDEEVHLRARLNTRGGLAAAGAAGLTRRARKQRRLESLVGDACDESTPVSSTPSSPLQADSDARESPSDQDHDSEGVSNPLSASEEAMQSVAAPTSHSSTAQPSPGVCETALNEMPVASKGAAEASRPNRQLSIVPIGNEDATTTSAARRSSQAVVPTQPCIRHRVTTTQLFNFLHAQQHSEPSVVHSLLPSKWPVASAASTLSPAASSQTDILDGAESHLDDAQKAELRRQASVREKSLLDSHIRAAQARHEQILHSLLRTKVDQHVLQSGAKIVKERIAKLLSDTKYKPVTSSDGNAAHEHQASGENARTRSSMSPGEPQIPKGKDRASRAQASVQNPLLSPLRVMQHSGSTSIEQDASTTASSGPRRVPRDEAGSSNPNLTRVASAPDELDTVESYFLSKENRGGEASLDEAGPPERDDTYAENLHALNLRPEDLWIPPSLEEALASISRNVWEEDLNDLGAFEPPTS
ncbi:hypothetical protein IE81DRAFT_30571 [Ceraceosorus guamensis]|uniref:Uncharacterized protein n=1 Tax=Ceraceosorus guamensis TaxID=1522189 RepID=A0A316W5J4_9BASI|nr:hypothetical protein IE81DRAFT_30571 [Ceraceosorus guamensis]PWN44338.1 hypothetical protein IE81DRAFT_30571 [Ceraceosorus guamensis]